MTDPPPNGFSTRASDGAASPEISVVLPTMLPWPAIAAALGDLARQTDAPSFEVLLVDGSGKALETAPGDAAVRWLRFPGLDTFRLRGEGIRAARGAIVAITEDHCSMPPDWLASIAAAHRAERAPAIVGAISNHPESSKTAVDRANFLVTFAAQNVRRLDLHARRLPVPTNVSFKRGAFADSGAASGEFEYRWLAMLARSSALGVSREVRVYHRQSWGSETASIHFASGRSFGASVGEAPGRDRVHWWLRLPLLPLRLARLVLPDLVAGAGGAPSSFADYACVAMLIVANVAGQMVGAVAGAGRSRHLV